jgi:hypothetical protein
MNLLVIIPGIIAVLALIALYIKRNQKDKKDFIRELIKEDEVYIQMEKDTEVDPKE